MRKLNQPDGLLNKPKPLTLLELVGNWEMVTPPGNPPITLLSHLSNPVTKPVIPLLHHLTQIQTSTLKSLPSSDLVCHMVTPMMQNESNSISQNYHGSQRMNLWNLSVPYCEKLANNSLNGLKIPELSSYPLSTQPIMFHFQNQNGSPFSRDMLSTLTRSTHTNYHYPPAPKTPDELQQVSTSSLVNQNPPNISTLQMIGKTCGTSSTRHLPLLL